MCDESIRPVTPEIMRERGAAAFDDHHMNEHTSAIAIADWRKGWLERRATVHARELVKFCVGEVSPP